MTKTQASSSNSKKAIILASKDISQNRRVPLIAKTLSDCSYDVDVFAYTLPPPEYADPQVNWQVICPITLKDRILDWLETVEKRNSGSGRWRRRFGGIPASGLIVGLFELIYMTLRVPLTRLAAWVFGAGYTAEEKRALVQLNRPAIFMTAKYKGRIDDKRRIKFHQLVDERVKNSNVDYDLIVCHDRFSAPLVEKWRQKSSDRRYIYDAVEFIDIRSTEKLEAKNRLQETEITAAKTLLNQAHLVLTIGDGIGAALESEFNRSGIVSLYNGRPELEYVGKNKGGNDADPLILTYSGLFFPKCGLEQLLKTMAILPGRYRLKLVGRFSSQMYEAEIFVNIKKLGLDDRINILARPGVTEIPTLLSDADLAIIPFRRENLNLQQSFPNRIFDALAAGLPIVGNKHLFLSTWVETEKIGRAADFQNPELAAATLIEICESPEIAAMRKRVKTVFMQTCWEKQNAKLKTLLGNDET